MTKTTAFPSTNTRLEVLRQPEETYVDKRKMGLINCSKRKNLVESCSFLGHTITISLLHDNRAHKDLNRANVLQWDLALACGLEQSKSRAKIFFRDGEGGINLVSKDQEGNMFQLLDGKKGLRE